ncbi:MAG: hypothetical protein LBR10_01865 [Prevotellaceae bacterium]|jgi:formate hydrogenlyase subunit 3/multisubunit Na+/H+ antiporter MnhD subunit|nr:hypothetical protein [Prevotellaceae bacterium]
MKAKDFKDIWKSEVDKNISSYSDRELNGIIAKSAKKSMRKIQPSGVFRLVVFAAVLLILINLTIRNTSVEANVIEFTALLILVSTYMLWEYSAYKMNKYRTDAPIKKWLECRIIEVEKNVKFVKKYNLLVYGGAILIGYSFNIIPQFLAKSFNWIVSIVSLVVVVSIVLFLRNLMSVKCDKTLRELNDLYKQFDE